MFSIELWVWIAVCLKNTEHRGKSHIMPEMWHRHDLKVSVCMIWWVDASLASKVKSVGIVTVVIVTVVWFMALPGFLDSLS